MSMEDDSPRMKAVDADRIEARAWADWFAAMPADLRTEFGMHVKSVADATLLLAPRLPSALFNRAIGLGMTVPATAGDLDEVVRTFLDAGCEAFDVAWNQYSEPAGVTGRLDTILPSATPRPRWAKMLRGTAPPPTAPSDLRIVPVDRSIAGETGRSIAQAYGMPAMAGAVGALFWRARWLLYAAMESDGVVGGGALFLDGRDAWLGMGAMLPDYRRRGGQRALMAQRIRDAITAGATRIYAETGEPHEKGANPSLNNMGRCGFEKVATRTSFVGSPSTAGAASETPTAVPGE
jgi:GNAT superfamily N-acetyltransferase